MKAEIYQWVRALAVFYIVFSALLHLVPDIKYERYIRSFMGILMIYILLMPAFELLGKGEELMSRFQINYQEEMLEMENQNAENLQELYLQENYTKELEKEISGKCAEVGIKTEDTIVHINGEEVVAVICTAKKLTQEQERSIRDGLAREFGIEEKNCQFLMEKDEPAAVAGSSAPGGSAYGDRASDIKNEK